MNEHYERLAAMLADKGQTWDLSPNDKGSIRWAAARIQALEVALREALTLIDDGILIVAQDWPECDGTNGETVGAWKDRARRELGEQAWRLS
jgi:hypothetical protein